MTDKIELLSEGGLKCDNPNCDFKDSTMEVSENSIGTPCPKCGENLLTEQDFINSEMLKMAVDLYNSLTPEQIKELEALNLEMPKEILSENIDLSKFEEGQQVRVSIDTHKKLMISDIVAV